MTKLELYAIGLIGLLLAALAAGMYERHIGYTEAKNEYAAAALKQSLDVRKQEQIQRDKLLEVSTTYEQQISQLKVDAASKPPSIVRVCNRPASTAVQANTASAAGPGSTSPTQLDRTDGPNYQRDIGPALDAYKLEVQALALRCSKVIASWPSF